MSPDWAAKPAAVPYASFGNPQSLNLYSYVNNNPTTTRDPDGHCPYVIYENLAAQTPEQIQQRSQAVTNIVVGIGKGLWNMVADTWNTGAELLNDQGRSSGQPYIEIPTVPRAEPENLTQAVSGGVAQVAVIVGTAVLDSKPSVPEEIPAGPSAHPSAAQQSAINEMGEAHGCPTCGTRTPGTKFGSRWLVIADPIVL